ncbi:MAG: hypothetical protein R6X31_01090 [Anaerolineae bacterium]
MGKHEEARRILRWVEAQADERGDLPEQLPRTLIAPAYLETWRDQRGDIARPLLWSHAAYLILHHAVEPT